MSAVTASRLVLAAVCFVSTGVGVRMMLRSALIYRWHLGLIAFWSAMFGVGMLALAWGWDDLGFAVGSLNVAATMTIGGWTVLVLRLTKVRVT